MDRGDAGRAYISALERLKREASREQDRTQQGLAPSTALIIAVQDVKNKRHDYRRAVALPTY